MCGLNPPEEPDSVYLDDVIVFSQTLDNHFISQEVQYLGHLLTPDSTRPNPDRVVAVRDYPAPTSVKGVRQFLGLASYYRRFVKNSARVAQPLHNFTQKGAPFHWSITEPETLAVVWEVSHFHAYLYSHDVQVFTDHSAVKAVLENPSPSGKYACGGASFLVAVLGVSRSCIVQDERTLTRMPCHAAQGTPPSQASK